AVRSTHRVGAEDRFIPLGTPVPRSVQVRDDSGRQLVESMLWEDNQGNRLLVFSETGRLKGKAYLNQAEELSLSPGQYVVLSRFAPRDSEVAEIWDEPKLFVFNLDVLPGQNIQ